jgi:metallo-beta-lactamase family protein
MAIKATEIYKRFKKLYNQKLTEHAKRDDPFDFPGLRLTGEADESKKIKEAPNPKVIIAGSGMMNGGRILHHAIDYLPLAETRLLIVGFQGKGTIGRMILEGDKSVKMYGTTVAINAHIRKSSGLSAHADQPKLLNWLREIKGIKKVFLVHGEEEARNIFAEKINQDLKLKNINLPALLEDAEI